ncbi:MAG TPA: zinc metalloprotease HtpX, partial [Ottowia sp.]|nr:zinc metalloprotease HtpX [Ottowia sp.]
MKRILLFVLTNVAVMAVVGLVSSLFGLGRYVGTNTGQLMIFSLLVGFTGAIVSLLMSKSMAKM